MCRQTLTVEYKLTFDPSTNQDLLHEVAESVKHRLHDMFDDAEVDPDDNTGPIPSVHDVTYEVVMTVDECGIEHHPRTPPATCGRCHQLWSVCQGGCNG